MNEDNKKYTIDELEEIRAQQLKIIEQEPNNIVAIQELVCADCMLCEEYVKDLGPAYKNAALCREIVKWLPAIIDEEHNYDLADAVCQRAADVLFNHPRLKLQLLEFQYKALAAMPADDAKRAELGIDDLKEAIDELRQNIAFADAGQLDKITDERRLKYDCVEWTKEYEEVIHLAEEKAYAQLADFPRGMGYCHAYWPALKSILWEHYKIRWRTPAELNRRVMFD